MATLAGILNALKEGETTVEEAFPDSGVSLPQPGQRTTAPPGESATKPSEPVTVHIDGKELANAVTAAIAPNIGRIVDILEKAGSTYVCLDTGFIAGTQDAKVITDAREAQEAGTPVELVTKAPSNPKFRPTLIEVKPRLDLMEGQQ